MAVLFENEALLILLLSAKSWCIGFLKKVSLSTKIIFKVEKIKNVQNFHWLSNKTTPISQKKSYFENYYF